MNIIDAMIKELQHEAIATRKVLERVPEDKFGWKPHEKSMTLGRLASHTAEIPQWAGMTLNTDEFVFNPGDYVPWTAESSKQLLETFDKQLAAAVNAMQGVSNESLMQPWKFKKGDVVIFELPRVAVLRSMILNHIVHHRGQLTVYLRLLDVPVPSVYGPSADDPGM